MFKNIYNITLSARSFNDLKEQLKDLNYIDERKEHNPIITVAAQLAIDGKIDRVDWLRQLGANASSIAHGYALDCSWL
jgi:hypothetical protein